MISVVVPVYNAEKYLNQCVDSLLNQTYSNIEVILVDDGSTDNSGVICDQYKKLDTRVKVIHQKNGRIAKARNAGIELASGQYITFIDSDDYIQANTYEVAMQLMHKYNADMVQWDLSFLPEDDYDTGMGDPNKSLNERIEFVVDSAGALKIMFDTHNPPKGFNSICQCCNCVWPKLFKRELFEQIRFPLGKEYEDLAIVHRLYKAANKIVFTNDRFSVYRLRNSSVVHSMPDKGIVDGLEAFIDKYVMILEWGADDALELLPLAAHKILANSISMYNGLSDKNQKKRVHQLLKGIDGYHKYLPSKSDRLMFNLFRISPQLTYGLVMLRRKMKKS